MLVGDETVGKVFLKWIGILQLLEILADIEVKELYGNLEHLVII